MPFVDVITCPEWEARQPRQKITWTQAPAERIIFHHTAGHHAEISIPSSESLREAIGYAQSIQAYHMDVNGWIDSGHNFLVMRSGRVLQGRWRTVRAIQRQRMVVSAHCPGQNTEIGIEHEHQGAEPMTTNQYHASAQLMAWIAWCYHLRRVLPVFPHSAYYATQCPANLTSQITGIRNLAQQLLTGL